jgi:hypothetical protein
VDFKYDIFIEHSNGAFAWVESAQDIEAAKQRLEILDAEHPGNHHLWDSTAGSSLISRHLPVSLNVAVGLSEACPRISPPKNLTQRRTFP